MLLVLFLSSFLLTVVAGFDFDPNTIKSCTGWWDNGKDSPKTCQQVRDYFSITPEQFSEWNPSVGLHCKPWLSPVSYCITTKERDDEWLKNHPTSTTTTSQSPDHTSSSTTISLGPSPAAWGSRGCYDDNDPQSPILEKLVSDVKGDSQLTIAKCQDSCFKAAYMYAGVKAGNQCWCSSYVFGEYAKDPKSCNVPCSGDRTAMCGGKDAMTVYEPQDPDSGDDTEDPTTTTTTTMEMQTSSTTSSLATSSASSNANGNLQAIPLLKLDLFR